MTHTLNRIASTSAVLFFITIIPVLGEENKDAIMQMKNKGCILQGKVEGIYGGHCVTPNVITRIKVDNNILEYTWIKHDSCTNSHLVLDHELLEDSLPALVVKINLKLVNKWRGVCSMQYFGEQEARIDLSQKLQEVVKEYSLQPDKASDSEGIYGFLLRNGQLHLVYRQPIIVELTLPTITLKVE